MDKSCEVRIRNRYMIKLVLLEFIRKYNVVLFVIKQNVEYVIRFQFLMTRAKKVDANS